MSTKTVLAYGLSFKHMNTLNISLIALSEWRPVNETGPVTERKMKQIKGQLAKLGKAAIISEHQIIVYETSVFEYNLSI